MKMPCSKGEMGGQLLGQCLPCAVPTSIVLAVHWLVRLRIVCRGVTEFLQPVAVGEIILLLTKVVQSTAGSDHGWCRCKVKVTSFHQNLPP